MAQIIINVDRNTARKWDEASAQVKEGLSKKLQNLLDRISYEIKVANFEALLDEASDEAARNGLTEEILEKLLNEE